MLDIVRRVMLQKRADHPLRPVTAPRACGAAGRQAAAIADQIFSAYPDIALHKVIRITRGDKGDLNVGWTWQPDSHNRVRVTNDHLYNIGVADMEETARWIAGEELRRIATVQAGPGSEDPVWGAFASPIIVDMLATMRIEPDNPTTELDRRIARAVKQRGGQAELQMTDKLVTGWIEPRNVFGRPWVRVMTRPEELDTLTISMARMPDTIIDALPGRTLATVVDIGPASADIRIVTAEQDGFKLTLTLQGDPTTILPVPDGLELRWVELMAKEHAAG